MKLPMENKRMAEIISHYCSTKNVSVLYFESKKDKRDAIVDFYRGKICIDFLEALKNDDDCFFEFENEHEAIQWADISFPTYRTIVGEYGDDTYFIEADVYDRDGSIRWNNKLI